MLALILFAAAAPAQQAADAPADQEPAPGAAPGDRPAPAPQILEPFKPSEKIEEDLAVPFPADI